MNNPVQMRMAIILQMQSVSNKAIVYVESLVYRANLELNQWNVYDVHARTRTCMM